MNFRPLLFPAIVILTLLNTAQVSGQTFADPEPAGAQEPNQAPTLDPSLEQDLNSDTQATKPKPTPPSEPVAPPASRNTGISIARPNPTPARAAPMVAQAPQTIASDRLNPGWNQSKFKMGIGFSSSFLSASNTFIFEKYAGDTSWSLYVGLNKSADTFSGTDTSSSSGTSTITTTTTHTASGAKNPYAISLGASYNKKVYRSDWIMVRGGLFGGLDYYTSTSYETGSRTESVSSATPDTVNITETNYGTVKVKRAPVLKFGPVIDTFVMIRWLPQMAVGLQGGMLYATNSKVTTSSSTRSRSYQSIGGVDQTPSSDTSSSSDSSTLGGPSISTFAVNGQTFNLFGNFVLRYVW